MHVLTEFLLLICSFKGHEEAQRQKYRVVRKCELVNSLPSFLKNQYANTSTSKLNMTRAFNVEMDLHFQPIRLNLHMISMDLYSGDMCDCMESKVELGPIIGKCESR